MSNDVVMSVMCQLETHMYKHVDIYVATSLTILINS